MTVSPVASAGRGRHELPRGGDGVVPAEDHADPGGVRVPGLHHPVRRHRDTGPVHVTRGG